MSCGRSSGMSNSGRNRWELSEQTYYSSSNKQSTTYIAQQHNDEDTMTRNSDQSKAYSHRIHPAGAREAEGVIQHWPPHRTPSLCTFQLIRKSRTLARTIRLISSSILSNQRIDIFTIRGVVLGVDNLYFTRNCICKYVNMRAMLCCNATKQIMCINNIIIVHVPPDCQGGNST